MKHLFRLVAILIIMLFQTSTAFAATFEISWSGGLSVVSHIIGYRLDGGHEEPFNGTGLTIGNSPASIGNVFSIVLEEVPETICVAVRGVYADGSMTPYSPVVCGTKSPSASTYKLWGNYQINFGVEEGGGYCVPLINANGVYYTGSTSFTLDTPSGGSSNSVIFQKAAGDVVLYTIQSAGGIIYPLDFVVSYYYQPMEVSVTPDYGKCLTDLTDNGVSVIQNVSYGHYTIASPIINHTVIPTFGSCFTLTASASAGGSISPTQSSLDYMGSVTLTITEDEGNELTELTDNGVSVIGDVYLGQDELLKYDVINANENHDVVATIEEIINSYNYLMWANGSNVAIWKVDANGNATNWKNTAASGWTPKSYSVGPDGVGYLLWANVDSNNPNLNNIGIWKVATNGSASSWKNSTVSGWTPKSYSVGPDGVGYLLWASGSSVAIWKVAPNSSASDWSIAPPSFSGYTPVFFY